MKRNCKNRLFTSLLSYLLSTILPSLSHISYFRQRQRNDQFSNNFFSNFHLPTSSLSLVAIYEILLIALFYIPCKIVFYINFENLYVMNEKLERHKIIGY